VPRFQNCSQPLRVLVINTERPNGCFDCRVSVGRLDCAEELRWRRTHEIDIPTWRGALLASQRLLPEGASRLMADPFPACAWMWLTGEAQVSDTAKVRTRNVPPRLPNGRSLGIRRCAYRSPSYGAQCVQAPSSFRTWSMTANLTRRSREQSVGCWSWGLPWYGPEHDRTLSHRRPIFRFLAGDFI
jgi:hypothetical protein